MSRVAALARNKYFILVLLFAGWIISYLDRMVLSVALTGIGKDLHLSAASLGVVLSSFFAGYALFQIPGGWLSDKYGSKKLMIIGFVTWSLFTIFTGFAWSLTSLLLIRFFFGVGESGFPAASSKAIAEYFPKEERAKAQSGMLSSNAFGAGLAPLVAAPMILWLGWRNMFFVIGCIGFIFVALYWIFIRKPSQQEVQVQQETMKKLSTKDLLRLPTMWKLVIAWFGLDIVLWGFASWLPSYLLKVRHLDLLHAGFVASLPFLAGGIAMVAGGWVVDRYFVGKEKYYVIVVDVLGALFLYLMFTTASLELAVVFQILSSFFLYAGFAAIWSLPLKVLPTDIIGSATGMINFGGQVAGFISPMVMGFLITAFNGSYNAAFYFLVFSAIISVIACLTLGDAHKSLNTKATSAHIS
ncbi:MFS transporter [Aneurinibacillus sp. Ricciae_BoGa-3]|uniref:MFS transporter n=1 Tax=Aneurinibacillus sp. Ricciae_BoGa-3 TaxID=3022697 RepID=UPI0023413055|nr:MFS transporter [Aneurinibacillus sp. Ricciae_BoGa-3]WCK52357.1 MFS transporter [Aneurinibacillus sp. Ricciae_BoGa-3]